LLFSAPVDCVPLTPFGPFQAPLAVQAVALTEVQLIVELPPLETALGPTLSEIAGAAALTLTVVVCDALPPGPVQVRPNDVVALRTPVDWEPLIDCTCDHPPVPVQDVAFLALQVSMALVPLEMLLGDADRATVGAGEFTDTVTD
jgi:hypothetical protein